MFFGGKGMFFFFPILKIVNSFTNIFYGCNWVFMMHHHPFCPQMRDGGGYLLSCCSVTGKKSFRDDNEGCAGTTNSGQG